MIAPSPFVKTGPVRELCRVRAILRAKKARACWALAAAALHGDPVRFTPKGGLSNVHGSMVRC